MLALPVPTCRAYDPAYAYELATIIEDGIQRMYGDGEQAFYYITVMNEQYEMPAMPEGAREGIIKGLYRFSAAPRQARRKARAQLIGSGAILNEVVKAQALLAKYGVAADVWSATSYNELYRDAHRAERWNLLHPTETPRVPYVTECLGDTPGVVVAASRLPEEPARHDLALGRPADRHARHRRLRPQRGSRVAARLLRGRRALHRRRDAVGAARARGRSTRKVVTQAFKDLEINPEKADPAIVVTAVLEPGLRPEDASRWPLEFKLPELGENVEKGDVVRVLVDVGRRRQGRSAGPRARDRQGDDRSAVDAWPARSPRCR